MKLKSIIALLLIALCVSLTTLAVSAADVPSVAVGDLNGDGYINTTDVVVLRRFIAGGYDVELVPPTVGGCNHVEVIDPAVAPTCTVTGLTEGKHCAKCGEVFVKQEVVPVTDHSYVNGTCTVCGATNNLTEVIAEFSTLKSTYTSQNGYGRYYLENDYTRLVVLFDVASVEINNAKTADAAKAILNALKADIAAIPNVKSDADAIAVLVADLGDVETEVFTTSLEKKYTAELALAEFYCKYVNSKEEPHDVIRSVYQLSYGPYAEEIGLNKTITELRKADNKIEALSAFITDTLTADMARLYEAYGLKFDAEGDDLNAENEAIIVRAYYYYCCIAKVNGGDLSAADLAVEWDYLYDENGKVVKDENGNKVFDYSKPIKWFTAEEFIQIYVAPYLNATLTTAKDAAINTLYHNLTNGSGMPSDIYTNIVINTASVYSIPFADVEDDLENIADAFMEKIDAISYMKDYKGNASVSYALIDIWTMYVEAYVSAANSLIESAKAYAQEIYDDEYEWRVEMLEEQYEDRQDANSQLVLELKLSLLEANRNAFLANLQSVPTYTMDELNNTELLKKFDPGYRADDSAYNLYENYIYENGVDSDLIRYINNVYSAAMKQITSPSAGQEGQLNEAKFLLIEDLLQFRDRLDPTYDDADIYSISLRGSEIAYVNGENYKFGKYYSNTAKFEEMVAIIDTAIKEVQAIRAENFVDKNIQLKTPDSTIFGSNNRKKNLYWVNEEAKNWFYAEDPGFTWLVNDERSSGSGKVISNNSSSGDFITVDNTGIPVTVLQTAEQQAILAAQTIYANAFNDVHQMIITLDTTNYAVQACKKITGTNEFKAIRANVKNNAELLAEIDAYAAVYTDKITSLAAEKKYGFAGNSFKSLASTNSYIDKVDNGAAFTFNATDLINAENYNHEMVVSQLQSYVDKFAQTFYMDESRTTSAVVELWNYRNYTVQYITEVVNSYKNIYKSTVINGVTHIDQVPGALYVYDRDLQAASAKGLAFEENLDALLTEYTAKIMAVKLNTQLAIKDYYGNQLCAKAGSFAWNFETARRSINAYVVDLLGREAAGEFNYGVTNPYSNTTYTAPDGMMYNSGDSRVFNAFKSIYLEDYNAYTPAR